MNRQLLTQQSQQPVVHPINGEQQYRYGNNQVYKRGANFNVAVQRKKNNHNTGDNNQLAALNAKIKRQQRFK